MKKIFTNPWVIVGLVAAAALTAWYFLSAKKHPYDEWGLMRFVTNDKNFGSNNHLPAGHRLWDSIGFRFKDEPSVKPGDRVVIEPTGREAINGVVLEVFQEPRPFKNTSDWWVATTIRQEQVDGTKTGTLSKRV